jgi:hypothetical protein
MTYYDNNATLKGRILYAGANGAGNKYWGFVNDASDYMAFFSGETRFTNAAASAEYIRITSTGVVFNEGSADLDFRIESDLNANLFVTDGANNNLGIGAVAAAAAHVDITQTVRTSGSPTALFVRGAAHTTLTASAEAPSVDFSLAATVQFATGALALQRAIVMRAPTYRFVGASTLALAFTAEITGAPVAGTNATITARAGARIIGGLVLGSAALATTAVTGFLYVPSCAGAPTGVPEAHTGTAAVVVDSTNNKLYFYSGGAWRDAGP